LTIVVMVQYVDMKVTKFHAFSRKTKDFDPTLPRIAAAVLLASGSSHAMLASLPVLDSLVFY